MQNNRTTNLATNCLGEIVDCVAVLVRHIKSIDNVNKIKFALKHSDNLKGLWLPYGKITSNDNWLDKAEQLAHQVNIEAKVLGVLQLTRFQLVPSSIYYTRVCYIADIPGSVTIEDDKKSHSLIEWFSLDQVIQLFKEKPTLLFGPEILEFLKQASQNIFQFATREVKPDLNELVSKSNHANACGRTNPAKSQHDQLLESAKFTEQEQLLLFHIFLHFSLPSETMSLQTFREFVISLGWEDSHRITDLFRAFDAEGLNFLTFRDLLLGLAGMEPCTQHGGPPAELRCRYIFRYYSRTSEGIMEYAEFLRLIMDINRLKGLPTDEETVLAVAIKNAKVFGIASGDSLPLNEFLTAIGQLKFRGTSLLLRAPVSTLSTIHKWGCDNSDHFLDSGKRRRFPDHSDSAKLTTEENCNVEEHSCDNGTEDLCYELATHAVKVRRSGTLVDVLTLWDFNDAQATPNSTFKELRFHRLSSVDAFNVKTRAHELLSGLRYFERAIMEEHLANKPNSGMRLPKEAFTWGEVDMQALFRCLQSLCRQVKDIMSLEPRLLRLNSPTYILGDIHGNYHDLVCFEKTLWRLGPILTPASFLFLGDYVDRGSYGVEVVAYLFAQKVMAPDKFFLLRGNHELRHIQKMFTFYRECIEKFGKAGEEIWENINQCFDVMPVAAVIDNKIFCVHGGIPPPWNGSGKISSILDTPCPLKDPQGTSPLVWELMWNDPLTPEINHQSSDNEMADSRGFVSNLNRGTGHAFSEDALKEFLTRNGLSHVVRAHEVKQNGFQVQMNGKLLTVFSSSHYCGGSNEAACVLADRHKLRLIRLDTS